MMRREKKTTWNSTDSEPIKPKTIFLSSAILLLVLSSFFFKSFEVKGRSMSGTIEPGSHVVINRLYKASLDRGDIVVLKRQEALFVKRVYKTEGDTVEFDQMGILDENGVIPHDKIYFTISGDLNNHKRACKYYSTLLFRKPVYEMQAVGYIFFQEKCGVVVPDDHFFVLGDNYYESLDSRFWGFISKDQILGKMVFTY